MTTQVKQNSEGESFADRLAEAMLAKGIGLWKLANATGITQRQIVNYRKGRHEPRDFYGQPTDNAHLIARELGVSVDWLLPPGQSNRRPQPDLDPAA